MKSWTLCFVVAFHLFSCEAQLPSYFNVCYRDDPDAAECLKNTIEKLLPMIKSGSPEFDLKPLDPMTMTGLGYDYNSHVIGGNFKIIEAVITGLSNTEVTEVKLKLNNPKKFIMQFDAFLPFMNIKAQYSMSGNVIRIPVKMTGNVDIDFEDVKLRYYIEGDIKKIGDTEYMVLKSFKWRFRGNGMKTLVLRNDDVVDGRPALNRVVVTIIRTAWRTLKDHILPALLPQADKALKEHFVEFFQKYPYDVFFPKRSRDLGDVIDKLDLVHDFGYDDDIISVTK